jgi:DNA-binding winged helix-turn-helix (wHTH) protein
MSTTDQGARDGAPERSSTSSVRILRWPVQRAAVSQLDRSGIPRLVMVDEGTDPPISSDCCQDWMWRSGGEREMRQRLHQLSLRALEHGHASPELDDLGMLHVGLRSVHLPPKERALVGALLRRFGRPVLREELLRAAWPTGITTRTTLPASISRLRSRVRWLGLEISGSSATGYRLRTSTLVLDGSTDGFEDELSHAVERGQGAARAPKWGAGSRVSGA